mmetsp:Transcript_14307/g.34751  ORF Transcript_14307/g.34751 Transcript_14307/m.34751 type:complete len:352 (+) Transcript_14307:1461-2516(+)
MILYMFQTRRDVLRSFGSGNGSHEEVDEPREGVLIHGLDLGEVRNREEQHSGVLAAGLIPHPGKIDLLLGRVSLLLGLGDVIRHDLRVGDYGDGALVLQDITLGRTQHLEDLIFDLLELLLVLRGLHHQVVLGLLQVRPLLGHHHAEKLIAQPVQSNHKIEESHLDRSLGEVVRVTQLGGDVEAELVMVLDGAVAQAQAHGAPLLEDRLEQQGLDGGVQLLAHILQQDGRAELDAVLQLADEVTVRQLHHAQAVLLLHVADPLVALALRVDDERPPARLAHNDGVVDGEGVVGQSVDGPVADLYGLAQHGAEFERVGTRDLLLLAQRDPLLEHLFAIWQGERPQVRDVPRA